MAGSRTRRVVMNFIMERDYKRFAEIGVAEGKTLKAIINWPPAIGCLKEYYLVDVWRDYHSYKISNEQWEEEYRKIQGLTKKYSQLEVIRKKSVDAAKVFTDHYLDMVFIDADHRYEAVKADIFAWLPKIRYGGLMLGHDYNFKGVRKAVNELIVNPMITVAKHTWTLEVSRNYRDNIKDDKLREIIIK